MSETDFPWSILVRERVWLNSDNFALTCTRPEGFHFQAGQYVTLGAPGVEREYTITSPPDAPALCFLVKRVVGGRMSEALARITMGEQLAMARPKGYLTYRPTRREVVFVGTGVGIAPYVAMAAAGVRGFTLIQGARLASGLFYRQELTAAASRYVACLSGKDEDLKAAGAFPGYVTAWVEANLPAGTYDFYLCGSRAMIHDMTHLLDRSFTDAVIYSEAYD